MDIVNAVVSANEPRYANIREKRQLQGSVVIHGKEYLAYSKYDKSNKLPQWQLKRGIDKAVHKFSSTRERLKHKLEERNNA